ncbi:MAG: glycosyltransferase [Calothrix sp. MO_167.B12]|nr:glycosyltransferase [Calothrix sp. MO_167.B12]
MSHLPLYLRNVESNQKIKVNILTTRMGGSHYAAVNALCAMIEQQGRPWEIRITDIDQILDCASDHNLIFDPVKKLLGIPAYQMWNQILQKGWTWLQSPLLLLLKLLIKLYHQSLIKIFEGYWQQEQPDLVVSLVPLYNRSVWEGLQRVKPRTPYVTVLNDFVDCSPNFWFEPKINSYVVCGTEKAVEQAHCLGVAPGRIFPSSGMIIHPHFYEPIVAERRTSREILGLDPDCLTGLVLFGGQGSMVMLDICQRLERFRYKLQLIFICGRNEKLAKALHQSQSKLPRFVTTFTKDIPDYMHLADFFIGKPNSPSISEALAMKLPVVVERNLSNFVSDKYNTQWVQEKQVGLVIPSFRHIDRAVEKLLQPGALKTYRANIAEVNHRAVFEVPDILQKILQRTYQTTSSNTPRY